MDAFYASIEQLDNPQLRGKPVLVGPDSPRGVVLTASYEARPFRVGSAMPMAVAKRRCPDALIVQPRFDRYRDVSATIMRVFRDFSPAVEAISLDEAFLDMTGTSHIFGSPEQTAAKLKAAIAAATDGLTVSVGISGTKFVAKVASGYRKPDGLTVVPAERARDWLAPQSVAVLWGAGPKTQARLRELGLDTVGHVAAADPAWLEQHLGKMGVRFQALANGRDARGVDSGTRARSLSCERTLNVDTGDYADVCRHLRKSADTVAARLRSAGLVAGGVRVKFKRSDFSALSRQHSLSTATDNSTEIYRVAEALAHKSIDQGPFRLIGLAAYDIDERPATDRQLDLIGTDSERTQRLDALIDQVAGRFGQGAIKRARDVSGQTVLSESTDLDFLDGQEP